MNPILIYTIVTVVALGVVSAVILFFAAQKFKVYEDPRIDQVEAVLPGANCGGCGFAGCRQFADALVKADDISTFFCPVGGNGTMTDAANVLGKVAAEKDPMVAVLRCHGTLNNRAKSNNYDGAANCTVAANLYSGDTGCSYGCLGMGECVEVCHFDALHMDPETGLPVVNQDNCTACNACVEICPKNLFELRKKGKKDRRIYVACMNEDKGGVAKKACDVACIGCTKCEKVCGHDAIKIVNFLAYIDYNKCTLCRKCVEVCPTEAIHEVNFPPKKVKVIAPVNLVMDTKEAENASGVDLGQMAQTRKDESTEKPETEV
ncbi:MAG: Nitrogen fixation protein rnfB [Bacteroidota bacterium]|jgi:Na+-translocating ferredoxin:NAD+ oxidoreductase RNF subunit RnfB